MLPELLAGLSEERLTLMHLLYQQGQNYKKTLGCVQRKCLREESFITRCVCGVGVGVGAGAQLYFHVLGKNLMTPSPHPFGKKFSTPAPLPPDI